MATSGSYTKYLKSTCEYLLYVLAEILSLYMK